MSKSILHYTFSDEVLVEWIEQVRKKEIASATNAPIKIASITGITDVVNGGLITIWACTSSSSHKYDTYLCLLKKPGGDMTEAYAPSNTVTNNSVQESSSLYRLNAPCALFEIKGKTRTYTGKEVTGASLHIYVCETPRDRIMSLRDRLDLKALL